ncbi:hypothetical protein BgiBS90_033613, partial [Biomphalaria glabrata]
ALGQSCRTHCGNAYESDCRCDELCWLYRDCCADYYQECLDISTEHNQSSVFSALFPTSISLEKMHTYWKSSILIQSSECTRTLRGDFWLVTKCSSNPEILQNFQELLSNIKQMKTKDSFLNYVSSLTMLDIVRGCEKLSPFKDEDSDILINFLFSDFSKERNVVFSNVFCSLCNGFISTLFDKSLKCSTKSNDLSVTSLLTIANNTQENLCDFFKVSPNWRKCSAKNLKHAISLQTNSSNKNQTNRSSKNQTNSSNKNQTNRSSNNQGNSSGTNHTNSSNTNQKNSSGGINHKSVEEINYEHYFSSHALSTNTLGKLKPTNLKVHGKTFLRDRNSCPDNETYHHWTGQCLHVSCPEGFVHYVGKCFKYISCNHSQKTNSPCLTWREAVNGKFIPISKLFSGRKFPKTYIKATFEYSEPLGSLINLSLKEFLFNVGDSEIHAVITNNTINPSMILKILQQKLELKSVLNHLQKVFHEFHAYVALDSKLNSQNNLGNVAKITESVKCFVWNKECNYEKYSTVLESSNVRQNLYVNNKLKIMRLNHQCDLIPTDKTYTFTAKSKPKDICISYLMKALDGENLMIAMAKIMASAFQFLIFHPYYFLKKIYLTFSNNMFGISKLVNLSTQTGDYKLVNRSYYNIPCPEGRTLTFSEVDVQYLQDKLTLKIYLNTEELPIDNVWFELSMTVDIYEPVIESCIISLCVLPENTSRFCPHSTSLKIPYSQAVFYKRLMLVSEDISQVEEFLKENKHTFHSPKNFLDLLKSSLSNVLVYSKTSYIKTNSGVVLCVDPSNIYKDDTSFILNLYENSLNRMSSRTKDRDSSFLLCIFSVLLQTQRYI